MAIARTCFLPSHSPFLPRNPLPQIDTNGHEAGSVAAANRPAASVAHRSPAKRRHRQITTTIPFVLIRVHSWLKKNQTSLTTEYTDRYGKNGYRENLLPPISLPLPAQKSFTTNGHECTRKRKSSSFPPASRLGSPSLPRKTSASSDNNNNPIRANSCPFVVKKNQTSLTTEYTDRHGKNGYRENLLPFISPSFLPRNPLPRIDTKKEA